jgi:hypothetical protein
VKWSGNTNIHYKKDARCILHKKSLKSTHSTPTTPTTPLLLKKVYSPPKTLREQEKNQKKGKIMTQEQFQKLIDDNPELTTHGFGINEAEIEARKELYSKQPEFQFCIDFLTEHPHIENWKHSYNLKHDVERFIESTGKTPPWIPQGAFILAAIKREPGWHGAWFSEYPARAGGIFYFFLEWRKE